MSIIFFVVVKCDLALLVALLVGSLKETRKKRIEDHLQKIVSYPLGPVILRFP